MRKMTRAFALLAPVLVGASCGASGPDAERTHKPVAAPQLLETRVGLGCLTLPSAYRVVTTSALIDAQYGYVEEPGQTWRIEWCSGSCGFPRSGAAPLATSNPEVFTYFWVDATRPESVDRLASVVKAFSRREEPWLCSCTLDETGGTDWLTTRCSRRQAAGAG